MLSPREGDCSAGLNRTPAWLKGMQSKDADYGGLSHCASLQKASSCQIRVDVCAPQCHELSDRVEEFIYTYKACFLEEKLTKCF